MSISATDLAAALAPLHAQLAALQQANPTVPVPAMGLDNDVAGILSDAPDRKHRTTSGNQAPDRALRAYHEWIHAIPAADRNAAGFEAAAYLHIQKCIKDSGADAKAANSSIAYFTVLRQAHTLWAKEHSWGIAEAALAILEYDAFKNPSSAEAITWLQVYRQAHPSAQPKKLAADGKGKNRQDKQRGKRGAKGSRNAQQQHPAQFYYPPMSMGFQPATPMAPSSAYAGGPMMAPQVRRG